MPSFRCPECGSVAEVSPRYGHEIVSTYCLKHTGGADGHTRPVRMPPDPAEAAPEYRPAEMRPALVRQTRAVSAATALSAEGGDLR